MRSYVVDSLSENLPLTTKLSGITTTSKLNIVMFLAIAWRQV